MSIRRALALALLACLPSASVFAQSARCAHPRKIVTVPATPRAGTLFRLRLVVDSLAAKYYHATVAGEPVHFRQRGDTLEAFAAVPVDSVTGVRLELTCNDSTNQSLALSDTIEAKDGAYRLEKLTVAPQFGTAPDSAIAARMQREAAKSAAVSRGAHDTPQLWTAPFAVPRDSRITSGFGNGRTFNGEVTSRHTGTDFAGAVGAPVRAINRGVVRIVDAFYLGGNVVYIDHGAGVVSAYLHLSRQLVAAGDTVNRGQVIGHIGATGRVTGPHLHLITRFGQISVDALTLLGKK
jgi:murein DD-endopeptidase MepM/ murein hydrolase activator NlpD